MRDNTIVGTFDNGFARVFDRTSLQPLQSFCLNRRTYASAVSLGNDLVTADDDSNVKLWRAKTGEGGRRVFEVDAPESLVEMVESKWESAHGLASNETIVVFGIHRSFEKENGNEEDLEKESHIEIWTAAS